MHCNSAVQQTLCLGQMYTTQLSKREQPKIDKGAKILSRARKRKGSLFGIWLSELLLPVLCKLRNVEVQFPIIEESPKLDVPTVRHVCQCCRGGSPVGHAVLEALIRTRRLPRGIVACLKLRRRVNNCTYLGHRLSARFHMATSSRITTQDETGANLAHTLARAHTHTHTRVHWLTSVTTRQRLFARSASVAQIGGVAVVTRCGNVVNFYVGLTRSTTTRWKQCTTISTRPLAPLVTVLNKHHVTIRSMCVNRHYTVSLYIV